MKKIENKIKKLKLSNVKISFSRIFYFLLSFIFFDWFHFNRNVFETFFVLFLFDWSESWGENWREVEKFFSANTQSEDGRLQLRWSHLSYYSSAPTYTPFLFFFSKNDRLMKMMMMSLLMMIMTMMMAIKIENLGPYQENMYPDSLVVILLFHWDFID